jgi:hypothetical protein
VYKATNRASRNDVSPTTVTASRAERSDSTSAANPTRRTMAVPLMDSRRAVDHSSRSSQLLENLLATNSGIVRSNQYHCDNYEAVEFSVLRHKE